ncbi:MAG TPA: hypothetical protein PLK90_08350 [Clostridiales bacterium]|nr:hypothetical protein [Clostridiales bacterium]HQP70392.1 hypothetical protein [Clostridiales bacterium]
MAIVNVEYCGNVIIPSLDIEITNQHIINATEFNLNIFKRQGITFTGTGQNISQVDIDFDPSKNAVPDVWRYTIKIDKKRCLSLVKSKVGYRTCHVEACKNFLNNKNFPQDVDIAKCISNAKCKFYKKYPVILLLLESPHKNEYTNAFIQIAPAQKSTGKCIESNIISLIEEINKRINPQLPINTNYKLIIANPIPFQTSLHILKNKDSGFDDNQRKLRDRIWKSLWHQNSLRYNFLNRLNNDYKPDLVINACTENLQPLVSCCIICGTCYPLVETKHPANHWNKYTKNNKSKFTPAEILKLRFGIEVIR